MKRITASIFQMKHLKRYAKLSDRYVSDRFLPDKAIDLIDEASSKVRLKSHTTPNNLKEIEQEIEKVKMKRRKEFMLKNSRMPLIYVINKLNLKNNMKMPKMSGKQLKVINPLLYLKKILVKSLQVGQVYHLQKLMKLNRIDY